MENWYFSEVAYPFLPPEDEFASMRVTLPNAFMDPEKAAGLWDRYLQEWQVADDYGLNVMLNEHHSTATCMNAAAPLVASVLARSTVNAKILLLGNPVANRSDPVRIAEEMALVDILSRGRLHCGFVRGVQYEVAATNSPPARMSERMWEAIELIERAWTTHDGPFNWEGEFFHHRQVNIWPRPYQTPAPPVWVSALNPGSVGKIAEKGYRVATFLSGFEGARRLFNAYRDRAAAAGNPASDNMLGYCALVYTGKTDAEGLEGARELLWYLRNNKVWPEFAYPPAYMPYFARAAGLRAASTSHDPAAVQRNSAGSTPATMSLEEMIERGIVFAGSAETVRGQIERFYNEVGGFGHLLVMGQAGFMSHETTVAGIKRFAEDVAPELARVTDGVRV